MSDKANRRKKYCGIILHQQTYKYPSYSYIPKIHVVFQEDIEEEDLVTTEETMEADMKIKEIDTIKAATLILADVIEEIQTGDLPLKMILVRPPQVNREKNLDRYTFA